MVSKFNDTAAEHEGAQPLLQKRRQNMASKVNAYGIIPLYTMLFTKGHNWFTTNLSVIANYFDKERAFFLWGVLVSGYCFWAHRKIKKISDPGPACAKLIYGAILFLFCAITTPYLPEEMPFKAVLHIIFAFIAAILIFLYLLAVIFRQYRIEKKRYFPFLAVLTGVILISVFLLVRVGSVSSILEIFVTVATSILLERLTAVMRRGQKLNELSAVN